MFCVTARSCVGAQPGMLAAAAIPGSCAINETADAAAAG